MSSSLINLAYASEQDQSTKGALGSLIVGGNGIFEQISSSIGKATYKVADYTPIEFEQHVDEEIELNQKSFIPREAIERVIDFYRHICKHTGKEAQANFYINDKDLNFVETESGQTIYLDDEPNIFIYDDIVLHFPYQINSQAQTSVDDEVYDALKSQMIPWIETHSHNTMSAFRSGTDKANSYHDGLQLVFGKVTSDKIDFHSWVTIRQKQFDDLSIDELNHLIDFPELTSDSIEEYDHSAYEHVSKGFAYNQHKQINLDDNEILRKPTSNKVAERKISRRFNDQPIVDEKQIEADEHVLDSINYKKKQSFLSKIKSYFK